MLLTRNHMIVLVQFGINKHLLIFAQTTNLLVLVYSKLHSNSCDYLQIEPLLSEVHALFSFFFSKDLKNLHDKERVRYLTDISTVFNNFFQ